MFSEQEKAHFAGYTDAEGCLSIYNNKSQGNWFAAVSFKQTQPTILDRLHDRYGGSTSILRQAKGRPLKIWRLQAIGDVRRFLVDVTPHLREKREQAEIILHEFDLRADHSTNLGLSNWLTRLKAKQLEPLVIRSRLAIAEHDPNRKCFACDAPSFARGFCAKHYQKATREGLIRPNAKGEGVPFEYGQPLGIYDAAYFAGYFDGDGSLVMQERKGSWYPKIKFNQTQPDALIAMHLVYGGSLTFLVRDGQKSMLNYQLCQRAAVKAFLNDIRPFVVEKHDQVEALLAAFQGAFSAEEGRALRDRLTEMKNRTLAL